MLAIGVCAGVRRAEQSALIEWAKKHNRILDPCFVEQYRHVSSGAEHSVFHDQCGGLAVKATHPNKFGHSAREEGTVATPLEYLRRLAWHNALFGDDIRFLGVTYMEGNIEVVTSQPWIVADERHFITVEEIDAYFERLGFIHVELAPDVPLYYNPLLQVLVADAHERNVLLSEDGHLVPIDVVVGNPSESLRNRLQTALTNQRASGVHDPR
jgi:hypothetical protein